MAHLSRMFAVAIAASAACSSYGGSFVDCEIACTPTTGCPPGFTCSASEGLCRSGTTAPSCAAILDGSVDSAATSCPAVFGSTRYLFVNTPMTWPDAEAHCKSLDSTPGEAPYVHLVVISNAGELTQLMVLLAGAVEDPWLGYSDSKLNPGGTPNAALFLWVTDEPGLAMWGSDQPDHSSGPRCADRDADDGLMHDNSCTSMRTTLCECDQFPENPNNL